MLQSQIFARKVIKVNVTAPKVFMGVICQSEIISLNSYFKSYKLKFSKY